MFFCNACSQQRTRPAMPDEGSGIESKCIWGTRGKSYGKKRRRGHAATSGSMGRAMISFSEPTLSFRGAVSFRKMGGGSESRCSTCPPCPRGHANANSLSSGRVYQELARVEVAEIRKISTIYKILEGKKPTDIGLVPIRCVSRMGLALGTSVIWTKCYDHIFF